MSADSLTIAVIHPNVRVVLDVVWADLRSLLSFRSPVLHPYRAIGGCNAIRAQYPHGSHGGIVVCFAFVGRRVGDDVA